MKSIVIPIIIVTVFIGGAIMLSRNNSISSVDGSVVDGDNVTIVDGKQIIEISARGGYQPRKSVAKTGVPTIIRFKTSSTFDCSSSVRIPVLNISKLLPQTGSTDIDIGTQQTGKLNGSCGMGMYPFQVEFQ